MKEPVFWRDMTWKGKEAQTRIIRWDCATWYVGIFFAAQAVSHCEDTVAARPRRGRDGVVIDDCNAWGLRTAMAVYKRKIRI